MEWYTFISKYVQHLRIVPLQIMEYIQIIIVRFLFLVLFFIEIELTEVIF